MCICLCLHLCITVIYLSISLEVTGSLFLFVLFAFKCSFDSYFLVKPLNFRYFFPISWILLSTLSSLSTWRKIHCFISDKQCDHSQLRNLLHFKLLPCKIEWVLLPWGPLRRNEWDGNNNANGCHCWHFLFIRYLISITSLIPKIFYLEGLHHYIPPFYWRGDWNPTCLYGLPKITEKKLYSNLCLCHGICIKFW